MNYVQRVKVHGPSDGQYLVTVSVQSDHAPTTATAEAIAIELRDEVSRIMQDVHWAIPRKNGDATSDRGVAIKSAIYCGHANEVPSGRCDCQTDCYCMQHTCAGRQ